MYKYRHEIEATFRGDDWEHTYEYNIYSNDPTEITSPELLLESLYEKDFNIVAIEENTHESESETSTENYIIYCLHKWFAVHSEPSSYREIEINFTNDNFDISYEENSEYNTLKEVSDNVYTIDENIKLYKHRFEISFIDPEEGNEIKESTSVITDRSTPYEYNNADIASLFEDVLRLGSVYYYEYLNFFEEQFIEESLINKKVVPAVNLEFGNTVNTGDEPYESAYLIGYYYIDVVNSADTELGYTILVREIGDDVFDTGASHQGFTYTDTVTEV